MKNTTAKLERRRTRESLKRALERIAARIAKAPVQHVEWYDRRRYVRETSMVASTRLWVAGSFARGALTCGDLDLILEASVDGAHPPSAAIKNALLGRVQDTSLYIGTPKDNSANIAFPEARLVWSLEASDWSTNIAAIPADPAADRYGRPTDRLPLRPDQLSVGFDELEQLLDLEQQQVLSWHFADVSEISVELAAFQKAKLREIGFGAKTRETLEMAISYFGWDSRKRGWRRLPSDDVATGLATEPQSGLTEHSYSWGFRQFRSSAWMCRSATGSRLFPHRSRRGPNGIWVIERGLKHPLEQALANSRASYLASDCEPILYEEFGANANIGGLGIDLFLENEDAEEMAEVERDMVPDEVEVTVSNAGGAELLALIAGCDLVQVDGMAFPLSRIGQRILQEDPENTPLDPSAFISALQGLPV